MIITRRRSTQRWRQLGRIGRALLLAGASAACGAEPESFGPPSVDHPELTPSPFVISDPVGGATPVFISLPGGAIPGGALTTMRPLQVETRVTVSLVGGGFDPVPVQASAGDTVRIEVSASSDGSPKVYYARVPATAPPVVVRTEPTAGKRDVPLNTRIIIVFSEPIDSTTLTGLTVQLRRGAAVVAGQVGFVDADHLSAEFVPEATLDPNSEYDLVITGGIEDLDGEALGTPVNVSFTTGDWSGLPGALGQIAFVSPGSDGVGHIYLLDLERSTVTQLTSGADPDFSPAWSPDRTMLAFHRGGSSASAGIWIMNADGSGATRRSSLVGAPSWSPDGNTVAVMTGNAMWFLSATGPQGEQKVLDSLPGLALYESAAWSPDGSTIAFEGTIDWGGGDSFTQIYFMAPDGSGVRRVTSNCDYATCGFQSAEGGPAWSPNGSQVVFWSYAFGISLANRDGSGVASVTNDGQANTGSAPATGFNAHPSWSPDGRWLVFQSPWATGQLVVVRADGSAQPVVVTNMPGGASSPAWSPN